MALQQAIEKAVYELVLDGVDQKLWGFADPRAGWPLLYRYRQERDGVYTTQQIVKAMEKDGELSPAKLRESSQSINRRMPASARTAAQQTVQQPIKNDPTPAQASVRTESRLPSTEDAIRAVDGSVSTAADTGPGFLRNVTSKGGS